MELVVDPPIAKKIREMQKRVRWHHPQLLQKRINQTHLVLEDTNNSSEDFSFLVIGDSGTGKYGGYNPQYAIAAQMHAQREKARFILHTGDVVYLVGSREYYQDNFIKPYQQFIQGGENPEKIAYDQIVFNLPFLPVPGNHDYYDLPPLYGLFTGTTQSLRQWFPSWVDWDVGWHGSYQGNAYARAFLDCLDRFNKNSPELEAHLQRHYVEHEVSPGHMARCLRYEPGVFTRIPNRYYSFRMGNIDFFALDSNTFNAPLPSSVVQMTSQKREQLQEELAEIEQEKRKLHKALERFRFAEEHEAEDIEELRGELEQLDEIRRDLKQQLSPDTGDIDWEQLHWLETQLIASWQNQTIRGRVIFFHHPPYVTEASKWNQGQTRAIRDHLRGVLDKVGDAIHWQEGDRPLVDLVINGHAHCLEHLKTCNTGHRDSYMDWIVCGGSGYSLRRQRRQGVDLHEDQEGNSRLVARSQVFFGKNGHGSHKRRPYSFLRVDVQTGNPPKFIVQPFISERCQRQWKHYAAEPFTVEHKSS